MRIGILGGTGPAGSALAARLASIGYTAVIGSRSADRAVEIANEFTERFPQLQGWLSWGDNAAASACDLVVIATPWDSAATTVQDNADALDGKIIISMANALVRVAGEFQPLLPPRGRLPLIFRLLYHAVASLPHFITFLPKNSVILASRLIQTF